MKSHRQLEYGGGNAVLDQLPIAELNALRPALDVYEQEESAVVMRGEQQLAGAYFPIDAILSVVVELVDGNAFEVDVIGHDGLAGAEIAIGATSAARSVLCQGAGRVAFMDAARLSAAVSTSGAFRRGVEQALRRHWFVSQQTVACNAAHSLDQRLTRWILMTLDAVHRPHFPMRLEFLHMMAGAQQKALRSSLERIVSSGAIDYDGSSVTVKSRPQLCEEACECYERQRTDPFVR